MPAIASIPTQGMSHISTVGQAPSAVVGGSVQQQQTLIQQDVRPSAPRPRAGFCVACMRIAGWLVRRDGKEQRGGFPGASCMLPLE
jgi:hypothetical protein